MYERPMVVGKLVKSFVRVTIQLSLDAPLAVGSWVLRKEKEPIWVSVKYEHL